MIIDLFKNLKVSGKKFALLLDPDKTNFEELPKMIHLAEEAGVGFIFIGGSLVFSSVDALLIELKKFTTIPLVLFPGSILQVSHYADGILYLSLISGRNPDYLIGNHVISAPYIWTSGIEVIPTGYMLVSGGKTTAVEYISQTTPLPADKPDLALATAMAGQMLGHQVIYMDAGSGAQNPIPAEIITAVSTEIALPLIVGGGIKTADQATLAYESGAQVIVVGNAIEENPGFLKEIGRVTEGFN